MSHLLRDMPRWRAGVALKIYEVGCPPCMEPRSECPLSGFFSCFWHVCVRDPAAQREPSGRLQLYKGSLSEVRLLQRRKANTQASARMGLISSPGVVTASSESEGPVSYTREDKQVSVLLTYHLTVPKGPTLPRNTYSTFVQERPGSKLGG